MSDFNEGRSAVDEVQFRITLPICLSTENWKFCEVYTTKVNLVPRVLLHFLINRKTQRNYQKRPWVQGWKKVGNSHWELFLKMGVCGSWKHLWFHSWKVDLKEHLQFLAVLHFRDVVQLDTFFLVERTPLIFHSCKNTSIACFQKVTHA